METNKTNLRNDKTRIGEDVQNTSMDHMDKAEEAEIETSVENKKVDNRNFGKIAMTGIGVMAGVAGAMGYNALRVAPAMNEDIVSEVLDSDDNKINSNISSVPNIKEPDSLADIEIAVSPNDNMCFNDAFAAARKEVGPNGIFEWRGKIFSTYYKEEWDNLSDEYKEEFGKHNWDAEIEADFKEENVLGNAAKVNDTEDNISRFEIHNDENGQEYIVLKDAITGDEVHISPEDFGMAVTDEKGEVIAFLTNNYLEEHPEPNGIIEFDSEGNCIVIDSISEDVDEYAMEPDDDDIEILNSTEEDIVVPEEFDGDYAVIDENGDIIENDELLEESQDLCPTEDFCDENISEINDEGFDVDDSLI